MQGTAAEYAESLKAVARCLDQELREVPDWLCCGATSAHAVDPHAALCLAADTLAKARRAGLEQVLAPCAMCYQRLAVAHHEMVAKPALARELAAALGEPVDLGLEHVRPVNLLEWLESLGEGKLTAAVRQRLGALKVACYYGCLLLRPPQVTGAREVEAPRSMERLLNLLGAKPVRWSMAMECCGASFALSRKEVVLRQGRRIYDAAQQAGAEVICLACPMCHSNLDLRQAEFAGGETPLPVVYLTQLLGVALGVPAGELGFAAHFVPVEPALASAGRPKPSAAP